MASELRVVLLGWKGAGKSSSGNTILGREEFDRRTAAQCVKRQAEVAGRQVTVVNTPGWYDNHLVDRTIELVKQEIVRSVTLCPPGPHTLLLVIQPDAAFTEPHIKSLEGHLRLLGDEVWNHSIVLFSYGDCLVDVTIEQQIESGEALGWLVEKCGNRYHVFNNENRADDTQVTELLVKIEAMVAANRGGHFQVDREILEETTERRKAEEGRAQKRMMKVQERRKSQRSQMGGSARVSELRVVLLGYSSVGKSSSGNTILGKDEFEQKKTAQCVKRQGEVAGMQVTVIDSPGWFVNLPVEITIELVKQEIVRSVSLCPPGPHTILLVIRLDRSFTEDHRQSVEGHLQLLGDRVWSHTIVLFTSGDCLGETSIEQHIEREGKTLQWLVEKCENRYHVFNNENRSDGRQVPELLDKIKEMVSGNGGGHYEADREALQSLEERRRTEEEGARQRLMKVQEQRKTLRSQMGDYPVSELRVVLLGWSFVGKSTTGNNILRGDDFNLKRTILCEMRQAEVAGMQVTVVDTPGWLVYLPLEVTTELVKQEIVRSVSQCPPGPHAFLLVIRLDESFTEEHRMSVEGHLQLLSERVWDHSIVLFICGDRLGDTIEKHIESEGKAIQWLVEKSGNRYHVLNNWDNEDPTQVIELLDKMKEMVAGNRGKHYEVDRGVLMLERRRTSRQKKAQQKKEQVMKKREKLRKSIGDSFHLSKLGIVLLGWRRSGKTTSGNTILGREEFDLRAAGAARCVKRQGQVAGRQVTVVDTPGWCRDLPIDETSELVKQEIVRSVSLCPSGPYTVLLVVPLVVSFTEEVASVAEEHVELLGDGAWSHTMVLFTGGDILGDTTIEQHIEREGKVLEWLVVKCGYRYHVVNNENKDDTQVTELLEKMEEMVAENRDEVFDLDDVDGMTSPLPLRHASSRRSRRASDQSSENEPQSLKHEQTPRILMPAISETEPTYRLQCPHAGVFQCSLTGLAFQMEGEGEVQYSTVQWDHGLLASTSQTPAGPLFSIDCPQGSVCQLHLPHCEIPQGDGLESLSVAHVSGESVELLPPLRVTDTHVVVDVTDLSLWGLARRYFPFITTRGQVLPFLQSLGPLGSALNLIVLPANVPLTEVERMQKRSSYISSVYSDCTLTRGEAYRLCCDGVERDVIQPEHVWVHWNYNPTHHPTFQVFLPANIKEVKLSLVQREGEGKEVWAALIPLGAFLKSARPICSAEEQLASARRKFVERVSMPVLDGLLDGLLQERVINLNAMQSVKAERVSTDRARYIIDMVRSKGDRACSVMLKLLDKEDNCLFQTLGFI